eukprot:scaffold21808_cov123-Isochrysis_galbana.AAC.9
MPAAGHGRAISWRAGSSIAARTHQIDRPHTSAAGGLGVEEIVQHITRRQLETDGVGENCRGGQLGRALQQRPQQPGAHRICQKGGAGSPLIGEHLSDAPDQLGQLDRPFAFAQPDGRRGRDAPGGEGGQEDRARVLVGQ